MLNIPDLQKATITIPDWLQSASKKTAAFISREARETPFRIAVTGLTTIALGDMIAGDALGLVEALANLQPLSALMEICDIAITSAAAWIALPAIWNADWWRKRATHRHYRGGEYRVHDIGFCVERQVPVAIYRGGKNPEVTFVRTLERFNQQVADGVPRFKALLLRWGMPKRVREPILPKPKPTGEPGAGDQGVVETIME